MSTVLIFDVDGTLYRGDDPYRYCAPAICRNWTRDHRVRYLQNVDAYLGRSIRVSVEDPWEALVDLARTYDPNRSASQEIFLETRKFMVSDACPLEVPNGLRAFLKEVSGQVVLGCASNSPRDSTWALLRRLGLVDYFDLVVPEAKKPDGLMAAAEQIAGQSVTPGDTLSIGDNYRNDIAPAVRAGWDTAYIHAYGGERRPCTVQGQTVEELLPFLHRWVQTRKGRDNHS